MAINPTISSIATEDFGFTNLGGNYNFYDRNSGEPARLYQHILSKAEKRIDIWDPFFNPDSAQVFDEVRKNNIIINILTRLNVPMRQPESEINVFADNIKNVLRANGVTPRLFIHCYVETRFDHIWHDRYLIIDEKDVYLIGTSITEQMDPKKNFGIYQMPTSIEDSSLIKTKMQECQDACITAGPTRNSYVRH